MSEEIPDLDLGLDLEPQTELDDAELTSVLEALLLVVDTPVQVATLATVTQLAQRFAGLLRERRSPDQLVAWVEAVEGTDIPELHTFASGLRKDWAAVTAGLTLPWSSGGVEGHVNRIKMLKRQMYGRANLDLLRRRVLVG